MIRIGVDFGGTKIEAAALDGDGRVVARRRIANPGSYDTALVELGALIDRVEAEVGARVDRIGVGAPGSRSPLTGAMRNANSQWLNGRRFAEDLEAAIGRAVRLENDANCFALSEAVDGAGAGAGVVFGVIIGTGCGGGVVVNRQVLTGRNGVAGEWGHMPLPWPQADEPPRPHWCGKSGCMEDYVSGTAFVQDYERATGRRPTGAEIMAAARAGEAEAAHAFDRYVGRLARGLAVVCDILDPDVIVLGGGMSNVTELYDRLPGAIAEWVFSDVFSTPIVQAVHGDSSGVRGAAWLWQPG